MKCDDRLERFRRVKRGEIYIATLDPVIGSEQGGTRPVLVVNNDQDYKYSTTIIVIPITSKVMKKNYTRTHINLIDIDGLAYDSILLCEQPRTIDKRRLIRKIGQVDEEVLRLAEIAIKRALDISEG